MIVRTLRNWLAPKPAPAPLRPFTDDELATALGLTRVVWVKPHVRKAPTNPKREALHAQLEAEVFPNGRPQ